MTSMTRSPPVQLLLDAWREVGRHLDIAESMAALTPRLAALVPLRRVRVRVLDAPEKRLDTLASVSRTGPVPTGTSRTVLNDRELAELVGWCRKGRAQALILGETSDVVALPSDARTPAILGPLTLSGTVLGVLIVETERDPEASLALIQDLLEPLAAALANDRRLHELARLREAVEADNRALLSRLERQDISDTVVGGDTGLRLVMERVEQVAPTDAPVLVLGETGAGKEVVARSIHAKSRRRRGPFLRVNCGAIAPELLDSELFGHERGAFTGAVTDRKGWFERADGGTLFLDEIAELPPAAQVRMLRVLQDGTFERVGGERTMHADVRIVAATHRDMRKLVTEGAFREDLWYRISVFPVNLPPLRERVDDIPALAAHFATRAGLRLHGVAVTPTPDDLRRLMAYDWPGNVRELASVIERAAILGGGKGLDLATALGPAVPRTYAEIPAQAVTVGSLEAANRAAITEALKRCHGRVEGPFGAARLLGVNASTLRSRMKKLDIEWEHFRERG